MNKISHFSVYKIALKNLTATAVVDALKELAKELGATIITSMTSEYWNREQVLTGLKMKDLPNGIGVRIENGQLVICGDPYNQHQQFERLKALIPQYIKIYGIKQKAKALPKVTTRTRIMEREIELVVSYG